MEKKYILDKDTVEKKLRRMAYEILEENTDAIEIVLVGIKENGTIVAKKIQQLLQQLSTVKTEIAEIQINKHLPQQVNLISPVDITDKVVIIIDDVVNSGKTLLYALKPILNFYPQKIQVLVLVERTHTLFPLKAEYVGLSVSTTLQEHIVVETNHTEIIGAYLE